VSAITIERASLLTGRQLALLCVIALHVFVIGGLMTMKIAYDRPVTLPAFKPVTATPITPDEEEPPPTLDESRMQEALNPQIKVQIPVVDPIISSQEITWVAPDTGTVAPPDVTSGTSGGTGTAIPVPSTALSYRAVRSPDDYYPQASITLQEEGIATVRICVGPTGRLEGRPTIERSSGSRRLDNAALQWAREALTFTPATRNGAPISDCKGFRVNFNLK
jgi:TonB family protein